jgi:hypothetical protein
MHHILKYGDLKLFNTWKLKCIPQNYEKFMSLMITTPLVNLRFIDSLQFLNGSLSNLIKNLQSLPLTHSTFSNNINTKGIFPYNFAKTYNDLISTTYLPDKIYFDKHVSIEDYNNALLTWRLHNFQNLEEYMLYYMKMDIYLLADLFETFRSKAINEDGLDPVNFFSIPGLSWASALKSLKHTIENIQDPEMFRFFESGIHGGMTFINKHHIVSDSNTDMLYIDINNLYGWALSQRLPRKNFTWITENLEKIDLSEDYENSKYGYVFEVDLEIPNYLHDTLDQLPLAPIKSTPPNSKTEKLLLTHSTKFNYIIHCRLLKLYIELGAKVTNIHRAIKFKQSCIFKDYIDGNTRKRAETNDPFEKDYYKLKNNSLYGKTVENKRKRKNIRLCKDSKTLQKYCSKVNFKKTITIADDFVAVLLNKEQICLDMPIFIGQAVLDLSKLRMYSLQYKELEKNTNEFKCELNIVAGDTDSFFIETKNINLDKLRAALVRDELLDTSNYPETHPLYSIKISSVIGKF